MQEPTNSDYVSKCFSQEDIIRIKQLIKEGSQVLQEIDDLKEGLKHTVNAIAEEIDVKPAQLNKAIKIAHKNTMIEEREKLDQIEDILGAAGVI